MESNLKISFSPKENMTIESTELNKSKNNTSINNTLNTSKRLSQNTRLRNKDSYREYYKDKLGFNYDFDTGNRTNSSFNNSQIISNKKSLQPSSSYSNLKHNLHTRNKSNFNTNEEDSNLHLEGVDMIKVDRRKYNKSFIDVPNSKENNYLKIRRGKHGVNVQKYKR